MKPPETPEHDKQAAVMAEHDTQDLGELIELCSAKGIELCRWDDDEEEFRPIGGGVNAKLAVLFDIDLTKIEDEKRAILEYQRWLNAQRDLEKIADATSPS